MQKQEFEERIERTVTDEQYKVIEEVYMWHPSIRNTSGKDEVAELYKSFGMTIFHDMLPRAKKAHELDELLRNAQREVRRMSDMMKMFVEQELQNQIKENYPHMQYPPGLYAKVVSVRQNGELYEATLKILDKNKQPDIRFPEVPKVKTDIPVLKNEIVAIVLMYGECKPYIIGRCF